jgi:hypothetical protein
MAPVQIALVAGDAGPFNLDVRRIDRGPIVRGSGRSQLCGALPELVLQREEALRQ